MSENALMLICYVCKYEAGRSSNDKVRWISSTAVSASLLLWEFGSKLDLIMTVGKVKAVNTDRTTIFIACLSKCIYPPQTTPWQWRVLCVLTLGGSDMSRNVIRN